MEPVWEEMEKQKGLEVIQVRGDQENVIPAHINSVPDAPQVRLCLRDQVLFVGEGGGRRHGFPHCALRLSFQVGSIQTSTHPHL